jgi:hypothetical protein
MKLPSKNEKRRFKSLLTLFFLVLLDCITSESSGKKHIEQSSGVKRKFISIGRTYPHTWGL